MKTIFIVVSSIALTSCAANPVAPGAEVVEITNDASDITKCKFLGEIAGSQGNFFTGDWTSNKNLVIGARNELRNETYRLGGNMVYVQDMKNATNSYALGTTNTTAIGKAYRCEKK
jgi:hypothetical protein